MTDQQQTETINTTSPQGLLALEGANTTDLPRLPPAPEPQWQQTSRKISQFLEKLPEYFTNFFKDYNKPLITVILIFAAIVTVKIVLAVLDAINDIPLLSPTFELIGIGYATWFTWRYLLKAETRQELSEEIRSLKKQIIGEFS